MNIRKPLTKSELLATLKAVGVATKDDVRQIVGEELTDRGVATKDDVRQIIGAELTARNVASKDDVKQIVKAELTARNVASKDDLKVMASKDDLRNLVTKDDLSDGLGRLERSLKRRMGSERNKILATIGNLATHTPTLSAFRELKSKVERSAFS